jgi:hypothetical protein
MRVEEPEPGRVMTESDEGSDLVTTWTVTPEDGGSCVRIATAWGASGVVGFLERLLAPRAMRSLYAEELRLLDAYARARAADGDGGEATPG